MPTQVNIDRYIAGDTYIMQFALTNADATPMDLTDATLKWACAIVDGDGNLSAASAQKTEGNGITITDAVNGACEVEIAPGDILTAGKYWHEFEVTTSDARSYTVAWGTIRAKNAIYSGILSELLTDQAGNAITDMFGAIITTG